MDRVRFVSMRIVAPDRVWSFTAEDGTRYYTDNGWWASLCKQAMETQTPLDIGSNAGISGRWLYVKPEAA